MRVVNVSIISPAVVLRRLQAWQSTWFDLSAWRELNGARQPLQAPPHRGALVGAIPQAPGDCRGADSQAIVATALERNCKFVSVFELLVVLCCTCKCSVVTSTRAGTRL